MNQTEKRISSWGLEDGCNVLVYGGALVDVDKSTHLSSPPARGIHIVSGDNFISPQEALSYANTLRDETCFGTETMTGVTILWIGKECPFSTQCGPKKSAVMQSDGTWKPAIRPRHQRP